MSEKKTSKFQDIKDTASDAAEIMRHIGSPDVLESLSKIKETATVVNQIMHGLSTPEMVKNIENFRMISENMNEASTKMKSTVEQLRETGVINEASDLINSAKGKINSFGNIGEDGLSGQDLREVSTASKEMLVSIKALMNELTLTVASSKKSLTVHNIRETFKDASDIYKMTLEQKNSIPIEVKNSV